MIGFHTQKKLFNFGNKKKKSLTLDSDLNVDFIPCYTYFTAPGKFEKQFECRALFIILY